MIRRVPKIKRTKTVRCQLRIIGGVWRHRVVHFANVKEIRPTPNRVRETVFNWLMPVIHDARCLDLCAGSGAMGFEAASRGARQVVMIDHNLQIVNTLRQEVDRLQATAKVTVLRENAFVYLRTNRHLFDIIFFDPPFAQENYYREFVDILNVHSALYAGAYIYIECALDKEIRIDDTSWHLHREQRAGNVRYSLYYFGTDPPRS